MRSHLGWVRRQAGAARGAVLAGVFDLLLGKLQTRHCYRFVFEQVNRGSRILDVGIGTGTYLPDLAGLIRKKELQVTGVDVRPDYLAWCNDVVRRCGLSGQVTTLQQDVFQLRPQIQDKYDYVVLVTTWTVLPDREKLLPLARDQLLSPDGKLIIANAFYRRGVSALLLNFFRVWVMGWIIGYGKCTHMDELSAALEASGYQGFGEETEGGVRDELADLGERVVELVVPECREVVARRVHRGHVGVAVILGREGCAVADVPRVDQPDGRPGDGEALADLPHERGPAGDTPDVAAVGQVRDGRTRRDGLGIVERQQVAVRVVRMQDRQGVRANRRGGARDDPEKKEEHPTEADPSPVPVVQHPEHLLAWRVSTPRRPGNREPAALASARLPGPSRRRSLCRPMWIWDEEQPEDEAYVRHLSFRKMLRRVVPLFRVRTEATVDRASPSS